MFKLKSDSEIEGIEDAEKNIAETESSEDEETSSEIEMEEEDDLEPLAYINSLDEEDSEEEDDFSEGPDDVESEDNEDFTIDDIKSAYRLVSVLKKYLNDPDKFRTVLSVCPSKMYCSLSKITESILEEKIGVVACIEDDDGEKIEAALDKIPAINKFKLFKKDITNAIKLISAIKKRSDNVTKMQASLNVIPMKFIGSCMRILAAIDVIQNGGTNLFAYKKMGTKSYNKSMKTRKRNIAKNRRGYKKGVRKRKARKKKMKPTKRRAAKLSRNRGRHSKQGTLSKRK